MTTRRRPTALASLAALLAVIALVAIPTRAFAAEAPSAQAQAAFAEIAGCLATSDELRVLMVVDESRSLKETDPDSQRTAGLLATLDSLSLLQQDSPDRTVNVAASTFAQAYTSRIGWGPASGSHLDDLRSFATNDVPGLNQGTATDYRVAMTGAARDLSTDPEPACRVMLWFTDGGLDVGDSASATAAAHTDICTPGGIADGLRSDGIHVIAAALFRPDSDLVDDSDRATLQQIAEGEAQAGTCGTVPVPQRSADGAYVSASDPSQLAALFASLMARISGFTDSGSVQCPGDACVAGTFAFPIDAGIARLRVIAVPVEGTSPTYSLTDPSGARADLPANGSTALGGFTVETSQAGNTQQIDVDLTSADPVGQWALDVKSGSALIDLYLMPGLSVALDPGSQQTSATGTSSITVGITGPQQGPVDPSVYGDFTVTGQIDAGEQVRGALEDGRWRLDLPPPAAGVLPSTRQLTVSVTAVTKPSGIELDPVVRQFVLPVSLSAYYPTIEQPELVLSPVSGEGESTGTLRINGSTEGPTRACISPVALSGPQGQDQVLASPQDACIDLAAGESGDLSVATDHFTVAADGTLNGTGQVSLYSVRGEDPQTTVEVPTRLSIGRLVDETTRWLLVLALLLASLAIPLALIYVLGRSAGALRHRCRALDAGLPGAGEPGIHRGRGPDRPRRGAAAAGSRRRHRVESRSAASQDPLAGAIASAGHRIHVLGYSKAGAFRRAHPGASANRASARHARPDPHLQHEPARAGRRAGSACRTPRRAGLVPGVRPCPATGAAGGPRRDTARVGRGGRRADSDPTRHRSGDGRGAGRAVGCGNDPAASNAAGGSGRGESPSRPNPGAAAGRGRGRHSRRWSGLADRQRRVEGKW